MLRPVGPRQMIAAKCRIGIGGYASQFNKAKTPSIFLVLGATLHGLHQGHRLL